MKACLLIYLILLLTQPSLARPRWTSLIRPEAHVLVVPWQLKNEGLAKRKKVFKTGATNLLMTDQNQPPEFSTGDIVKFLRETPQPVALVCYHKAAADCLEALLQFPELAKRKVQVFISLNGKLRGSEDSENLTPPVVLQASKAGANIPLIVAMRRAVDWVLSLTDRHSTGDYALRPETRARYLRENDSAIRALASHVSFFSYDDTDRKYGHLPVSRTIFSVSK